MNLIRNPMGRIRTQVRLWVRVWGLMGSVVRIWVVTQVPDRVAVRLWSEINR